MNEVIGKEGLALNDKLQLYFGGLSCGQRYLPAIAESVVEFVERESCGATQANDKGGKRGRGRPRKEGVN